ncbi:MAG: bifunctional nuclease family protein [Candidatus Hydrothermarchaeaceae archaeon]
MERDLEKDFQRVNIGGVFIANAPTGATHIVFLEDNENNVLPIYIGAAEAFSIQTALEKIPYPRPLTHDLLLSIVEGLKFEILKVVIDDLNDGIFFARLIIRSNGEEHEFDARPSDSLAIAARCEVPVYVANDVMETASVDRDSYVDKDSVRE